MILTIMITKVDKSNVTMAMRKEDYKQKMFTLLSDENIYEIDLKKDSY